MAEPIYKRFEISSRYNPSEVSVAWPYRNLQTIAQFNTEDEVTKFLEAFPAEQLYMIEIDEYYPCECCQDEGKGLEECLEPDVEWEHGTGEEWLEVYQDGNQ